MVTTDPVMKLALMARKVYDADRTKPYHNWNHVQETLNALRIWCECSAASAQLALTYHDIVYVPDFAHNEEASAKLLRHHAQHLGVTDAIGEDVIANAYRMILATQVKNHLSPLYRPIDEVTAYVMDCDLITFMQPDFEDFVYKQDCIIAEKAGHWVLETPTGDALERLMGYRRNVADFLETFLMKPRIYHSEPFRQNGEHDARNNIQKYQMKYGT